MNIDLKIEPIQNWQKDKQETNMNNLSISSIKTVYDMRRYVELTGDIDGLVKKYGIPANEIEEMISCFCQWSSDWVKVQQIVDNLDEEYALAYERSQMNYHDLKERAGSLLIERMYLCDIGFRQVRLFLLKNYKHKRDKIAKIYQLAMDIEDKTIKIWDLDWLDRKTPYEERTELKNKMEEQKAKLLRKLISCYTKTGYEYGWRSGYRDKTTDYVYFDLPNNNQISFRAILSDKEKIEIPKYSKRWNGMNHHTLQMIQDDLMIQYPELKEISKSKNFRIKLPCREEEKRREFFLKYVY
jgi:hypothetical protein